RSPGDETRDRQPSEESRGSPRREGRRAPVSPDAVAIGSAGGNDENGRPAAQGRAAAGTGVGFVHATRFDNLKVLARGPFFEGGAMRKLTVFSILLVSLFLAASVSLAQTVSGSNVVVPKEMVTTKLASGKSYVSQGNHQLFMTAD